MIDSRGPLDKALPLLNAALSALLAFSAVLASRRGLNDEAWRGFLPAGNLILCCFVYRLLTLLV